jgi:hypothetical protein
VLGRGPGLGILTADPSTRSHRGNRKRAEASQLGAGAPARPVARAGIDLFWLPLGAGRHSVRLNGRAFEAVAARAGRRPMCDLYHSALEVYARAGRFVIEITPVAAGDQRWRGVVAGGAVVPGGRDACGPSDTRCVGGTAAGSRTSTMRLTARGGVPTTSRLRRARSTSCRRCGRPFGDARSFRPAGKRKIMIAAPRYLDAFAKIDGSWNFAERTPCFDWSETRPSTPGT